MSNGVDFAVSADLKYILITKDVKKVSVTLAIWKRRIILSREIIRREYFYDLLLTERSSSEDFSFLNWDTKINAKIKRSNSTARKEERNCL